MVFERQIRWQDRPNENDAHSPYKLFRTPKTGYHAFFILSRQITGVPVHYFRGRSTPCTEPTCEACDNGIEGRWRGYIAGLNISNKTAALIELTAGPGNALAEMVKVGEPIRGKVITLSRPSGRANGSIQIDLRLSEYDEKLMPEPFNVIDTLKKIWRVQDHMPEPKTTDLGTRKTSIMKFGGRSNGAK